MKVQKDETPKRSLQEYLSGKNNLLGERIFKRWFQKEKISFDDSENNLVSKDQEQQARMLSNIWEAIDAGANSPGLKTTKNADVTKQEKIIQISDLSLNEKQKQSLNAGSSSKSVKTRKISYRWAASVAILILSAIAIRFYFYDGSLRMAATQQPLQEQLWEVVKAEYGQKSKITLTDGSRIILNSGSEIRFLPEFASDKREIFLTGEAYFDVARDTLRPFIILTSDVKTTVLGTSFNIRANDNEDNAVVTVSTGQVQVEIAESDDSGKQSAFLLTPSHQLVYDKKNGEYARNIVSNHSCIAWKDNIMIFDNKPMGEIAVTLERWFDVKVSFEDRALKEYRFNGRFENPRLNNILEAICFSIDIDYIVNENGVIFKKNGNKT